MQDDEVKGKNGQWYRVIEDRLSNLSGSVEALLRKSDSDNRQLSVSLSQGKSSVGRSIPDLKVFTSSGKNEYEMK